MGDMDTGRIGHSVKVEHCHALQEDGLIGKPVLEKAGQIQCRGSISPLQLYFIAREIGAWTSIRKEIRLVNHIRDALDIRIAPLSEVTVQEVFTFSEVEPRSQVPDIRNSTCRMRD